MQHPQPLAEPRDQPLTVPDTDTMLSSDTLLLTSDVARLCAVSGETVRQWERQGRLAALRTLKGVRLFAGADVSRLLEEREARETVAAGEIR
jgi:hypothetical protein